MPRRIFPSIRRRIRMEIIERRPRLIDELSAQVDTLPDASTKNFLLFESFCSIN
jgi:hypothetical protein